MTSTLDRPTWSDDGILADRVRSRIGPIVKRMDQPRMHVMAAGGVVSLHGEVSDDIARIAIEHAAGDVLGVRRVDSHLHVGLARGDSRPSNGRRHQDSPLLHQLMSIARDCGLLTVEEQRHVLRGALGILAVRLPERVRRRFLQHLPSDVRRLATPTPWLKDAAAATATQHDFVELVAIATMADRHAVQRLIRRVVVVLRAHAPEDAHSIAEALPPQLREWWLADGSPPLFSHS